MQITETENLILRLPEVSDAAMIYKLFNQQDCVKFIGDKNIKNLEDAEKYITEKFLRHYKTYGFCLYIVCQKQSNSTVGLCGLIKRKELEDVDIGFAILTEYQSKGYVTEAAIAVKNHAIDILGLKRLVGITDTLNHGSIRVLEKIGMTFEKHLRLNNEDKEIKLYGLSL
ncbi:MAG: RimJ/RimL family protein N-acetyltransferase [Enterobacterales bacterium]|jgi:RimJ/RimL family protein N-acetyltransferase